MSDSTTPRAVRLRSLDDVRRFLALLINEVRRGETDPNVAGKLGYLTNLLAGCIKDSDLESRIASIEEVLASKTGGTVSHDAWVAAREDALKEVSQ